MTPEILKKLEKLSNLHLSDEEKEKLLGQME